MSEEKWLLTLVVFLPTAGALGIALFVRDAGRVRRFAAGVTVADLALATWVFLLYAREPGGFQLAVPYGWIPLLNAHYYLGVDGLSAPLVLLTGLLGMCAAFGSWNIQTRVREYFVWLLLLQTAVMGVFTALDFLLFFLFWEMELMPMYFLISVWGTGRKEYSAMKFLIFTILGSAFMLVALLAVYFSTGTLDMVDLGQRDLTNLKLPAQLVYALFFLAFAIKLPVWPLHTWLPDAHTDAPTAVSVMLAGVLIKMGGYGMIRVLATMFPEVTAQYAGALAVLAVVSVLYGAVVTVRQTDLKRMIAYSSVSHMGYVVLGISSLGAAAGGANALGLNGAAMQMFAHGTITGLLFLLVGQVYDKAHTRHIPHLGGLASRMPFTATVFLVAGLASLGLPSLAGFVAEVMVFLGTFPVWGWPTILAVVGIVLTAGYMLWAIQRVLFGPALERFAHVKDASLVEAVPMVALLLVIVLVGVYPAPLADVFNAGAEQVVLRFGP